MTDIIIYGSMGVVVGFVFANIIIRLMARLIDRLTVYIRYRKYKGITLIHNEDMIKESLRVLHENPDPSIQHGIRVGPNAPRFT